MSCPYALCVSCPYALCVCVCVSCPYALRCGFQDGEGCTAIEDQAAPGEGTQTLPEEEATETAMDETLNDQVDRGGSTTWITGEKVQIRSNVFCVRTLFPWLFKGQRGSITLTLWGLSFLRALDVSHHNARVS